MVVSSQLYGGTVNLFRLTLPKFGIKTTFVKPRDTEGFKKAIQPNLVKKKAINHKIIISNGGTFTGNASTVSHGVLTISSGTYNASSGTTTLNGTADVGMRVDGTFNNNDGTFVIDGSITKVQMGSIGGAPTGFSINNAPFHHLTINDSINFAWADKTLFNVEGDLIVAAGQTLGANNTNGGIKVLGDVTLNGQLGNSNLTNDCEFGSLQINSGGTYFATSGTTTITNEKSGHAWKNNGGTFTHNNGKVIIDFDTGNLAGDTEVKENTFYDLEVKLDQAGYELRLEDHSSTNAMDILNNLTVTKGIFDTMTKSDTLTIHGQTIIESDGVFTEADHDTNKIIHNGIVRNSGTYKINDGTTVKMNGGIRNLGTITVA
jgi:hypothetical protein